MSSSLRWLAVLAEFEAVLGSAEYVCGESAGVADLEVFPLLRLCVPSKLKSRHAVIRPIPSACLDFSFAEQVRNRNSIRK